MVSPNKSTNPRTNNIVPTQGLSKDLKKAYLANGCFLITLKELYQEPYHNQANHYKCTFEPFLFAILPS
jgi:hypothetical protein